MPSTVCARARAAALLIAAVAVSIPYVLAISPYWNISPDSATYVGGAQSLMAGAGYTVLGRPIYLQPPMTSLIYAATLWLLPDGYLALRIVTVVFVLLALGVFFFLARRDIAPSASLAVVVLSLASVSLLHESTRLLSEMLYLFFSIVALVVAAATWERQDERRWAAALGVALFLTVMTRTIGLILPCAILAYHGLRVVRRQEGFRPRLTAATLAVLAVSVLWDLRSGNSAGLSYFKLLMQREMWVDEAGYLSPVELAARFVGHLSELGQIGGILTNGALPRWPHLAAGLMALGTALFLTGLFLAIVRGPTPTTFYLLAYLAVSLAWSDVDQRFFVPIIPFLFLYAAVALVALSRAITAPRLRWAARAALVVWGVVYVLTGLREARAEIVEQHHSPFGVYPIKYPWNYDAERLALWLRDHGRRGTAYASPFPDVYDFITERPSIALPLTRDPETFFAELDQGRIGYVLLSLKDTYVREYAVPIIERYPERFVLIRAEPEARLYEYRWP